MKPPRCAVASPHVLATEAATASIRRGGNAIDAALSAALALTVVYPHNTSLGGDLIALVRDVDGSIVCINSSGPASRHADVDTYRARYAERMPVSGIDTVTVPGAVAGLGALYDLGASLPWRDHFVDPLRYATLGVPVAPSVAMALDESRHLVAQDPGMSSLFLKNGEPLRADDVLRQPALAASLLALAENGPRSLYEGELSEALIRGLSKLGSQLDKDDFSSFRPSVEKPLHGTYRGWDVWTSGPNTQGFALLEILGALDTLGDQCQPLSHDAGLLTELFRVSTTDRERALADPIFVGDTVSELLTPSYLLDLAAKATRDVEGAKSRGSVLGNHPRGDTVAVVTADEDGRAVCLIQSLFHSFGSVILEPTTGIILHNRGSFFSLSPTSLNVLAGGKRPAHTLMPVMVTKGGDLSWVIGTMGGKAQPQILAQVLLRIFAGESPSDAVSAPRWIVGGLEVDKVDEIAFVESSITEQVRRAVNRSIPIEGIPFRDERTGHTQLVAVQSDGELIAVSDPRSDGEGHVEEASA